MTDSRICGHAPFPNSGAYGSWYCKRGRRHLGRHRFNNSTWPRFRRWWRVGRLLATYRGRRSLVRLGAAKDKSGLRYDRVLYPTRYDPR